MKRARSSKMLAAALTAAMAVTSFAGILPQKTEAAAVGGPVEVYTTTWDKSKLLEKEADVSFRVNPAVDAQTIHVDETKSYQTMDGFGASLTDSSAYVIYHHLGEAARRQLMEKLFDADAGAGISYLRLPMGASDFSVSAYSYDDMPEGETDPKLAHFSIAHDEAYIIPVLKQALAINPQLKIMGSPWSAPGWMKTTGKLQKGKLLPEYYGAYAQYFVKFIKAYEAAGVPIHAITLQNEPHYEPADYPGMRMEPADQAEFVRTYLGPAFREAGITTEIIVWDHNWSEPGYPIEVLSDPEARAYIAGSAFHGYAGTVENQAQVHDLYPDKGLYFTESSGVYSYPVFGDNVNWDVSKLIIGSTRYWAKAVLKWNLALDENHGPTIGGCKDCRGVVTVGSDGGVTLNEEYYAFGHAAKLVQPGAVRIGSNTFDGGGIENVAFKNPDRSKVLIALNPLADARTFKVQWGEQSFFYTLPGKAVATFKWSGEQTGASGVSPYSRIEAEDYTSASGVASDIAADTSGGRLVRSSKDGDYIRFDRTGFVKGTMGVKIRYAGEQDAKVEFRLGSPNGPYIGEANLTGTGGSQIWKTKQAEVNVAEGVYDLYAVFTGQTQINWFQFGFDSVRDGLNYLTRNGDFEEGNLDNWQGWSPKGQDSAQKLDTDSPRSGSYKLTHWSGAPYEQTTYRTVKVPNGTYKASVWVKKGEGIDSRLEVKGYGGPELHQNADSGYIGSWTPLVIPEIRVTTGQVEIGVHSAAGHSEWAVFDDFELSPVTTKAPAAALGAQAPGIPQGVTAATGGAGYDINLIWEPVDQAAGYKIYRSSVNPLEASVTGQVYADYKEIGMSRAEAPTFSDKGLRGGSTSYYRITAFNEKGESSSSGVVRASTAAGGDTLAPAAPAGVTAVPGVEQISLRWDHSLESDFAKYNVYMNGVKSASVDPVTESRYTAKGLSPGQSYTFRVTSVDQAGNESDCSKVITIKPLASGTLLAFNNMDFETGNLAGWSEWHPAGQAVASSVDNDSPRGKFKLTHWGAAAYQQSTYRTLEVPNGTYKVQVWARTGGGQNTFRLEVKNYGGDSLYKDLKSASGSVWTPFFIDNIHVVNGRMDIGVFSDAKAGNWAAIDDFEVYSYPPEG